LSARVSGEPVAVSVCHCLACQKRSGAPFAAHARFSVGDVTVNGDAQSWTRTGDEGNEITHGFCPRCGSTLSFVVAAQPDVIAIPVGAFGDPAFPPPEYSVYEDRMHSWVGLNGDIQHYD
tara:strand:- start:222 stop:581 length:360 start_codon:yes stop_codon:yes gene_type:complete